MLLTGLKVAILLVVVSSALAYKDYKDFRIYKLVARTEKQQEFLYELSQQRDLDFFNFDRILNQPRRVLVPPSRVAEFEAALSEQLISYSIVVDDVSKTLPGVSQKNYTQRVLNRLNVFERFYRHDEINAHLEALAQAYPTRVFVKNFGRTYEGRTMKMVTITNGDGRAGKKIIYVDGTMHAREWISPAMALHIISELVDNFATNTDLLTDYDWVVLPVVNADGYEYTHEVDRYWRKTRKPNADSTCEGTDPNRNFDYEWGRDVGSSSNPCDQTYRGEKAFSEPETQVVRDIMRNYGERLKYYLSIHSYGNYILLPWGFKSELPDSFDDLMEVAEAGAMSILIGTGGIYTYGGTFNVLYATSGDSADYAYGGRNIPVGMVMELPAGGPTGFDPPVRLIEEFVTETWLGVRAMANAVVEKY